MRKLSMFIIEDLENNEKLEEGNKNLLLGQEKQYWP